MHGPQRLSVGRLLETDGLGRPRLVVLSACETGLYDIDRNPDEFIGLPGTFTALGAAGVLGTLWPVNDTATALLIAKFYDLHMGGRLAPPTALRQAQLWLRQATNADLAGLRQGRGQAGPAGAPPRRRDRAGAERGGAQRARATARSSSGSAPRRRPGQAGRARAAARSPGPTRIPTTGPGSSTQGCEP